MNEFAKGFPSNDYRLRDAAPCPESGTAIVRVSHENIIAGNPALHRAEAVARYSDQPSMRSAVFLHPNPEETVKHCRHSLSQETPPAARHSQSGRSSATHRRSSDCPLSHRAHDALCHRRSQRGVDSPEDQRRGQPTHGSSRPSLEAGA
jgi:hypothetical protein